MSRYSFHCVAPEVPGPGSTDDLDEALLFTCSYFGSHFDIWDNEKGCYIEGIHCQEDEDDLRARITTREAPIMLTLKDRLIIWSASKILHGLERTGWWR